MCPTNFILGLVGCGTVPHKLHVGSRGLWHRVTESSCCVSKAVTMCPTNLYWLSWAVAPSHIDFMLRLVGCGRVSNKLHIGSRGLWHCATQTSHWFSWAVAPCHTNFMLGLVGSGTVPHDIHVGSCGMWHSATQT
jgi:hypothetical protein